MAARKMTFSLPEALAAELITRVAALACDEANGSEDTLAIEQEFEALPSDVVEPWTDAPSR